MHNIAIIILAAGNSSRLGKPKQLLQYKNKSLIQGIAEIVISVENILPIVVLGSSKKNIEKELSGYNIEIIENNRWHVGMSTSITAGLAAALSINQNLDACMFTVCDQPFITADLLKEIINVFKNSNKGIIASAYGDTIGTPMLFDKKYFAALAKLQNDEGAKKIALNHSDDIETVAFEAGIIDIDTTAAYTELINTN